MSKEGLRSGVDISGVDPAVLAAIQKVVRDEMTEVNERLTRIDTTLNGLKGVLKRVEVVEKKADTLEASVQVLSDEVDEVKKDFLPAILNHIAAVAEQLAHYTLKIDAHRRKWNVVVSGLEGPPKEEEHRTRERCVRFAKDILRVPDAEHTRMSACHRLSSKKDASIIIRFSDLSQRDRWLAGTKNLRGHPTKISVSPDIPPTIRPHRDKLMLFRSQMTPELKMKSRLRYTPEWPFVELRTEGQAPKRPDVTLRDVTPVILGIDHVFHL